MPSIPSSTLAKRVPTAATPKIQRPGIEAVPPAASARVDHAGYAADREAHGPKNGVREFTAEGADEEQYHGYLPQQQAPAGTDQVVVAADAAFIHGD